MKKENYTLNVLDSQDGIVYRWDIRAEHRPTNREVDTIIKRKLGHSCVNWMLQDGESPLINGDAYLPTGLPKEYRVWREASTTIAQRANVEANSEEEAIIYAKRNEESLDWKDGESDFLGDWEYTAEER